MPATPSRVSLGTGTSSIIEAAHNSPGLAAGSCLGLDLSQEGQPDGLSVSCGIGRLQNPKRPCAFVALGSVGVAALEGMTCRIRGPSEM